MKAGINSEKALKVIGMTILILLVSLTIYPLIAAILISVKPIEEFTLNPIGLPDKIRLQNFPDAWIKGKFSTLFLNSFIVTVSTIICTILLTSPAGFALAKLKMKGEKMLYNYLILGLIVPIQVIMIPLMKIARTAHMMNRISTLVIIFTATGIALPIIIYTGFYKSIPDEILEAARIDGCNVFMIFSKILFPLTGAVNATVAIFAGMNPWKDFFIPLIFSTTNESRTLPVGLFNFTGSFFNEWTTIFAAIIIQSIPLIILYILLQKTFISGVTSGAVKA